MNNSLYQINTRVWLNRLSQQNGRPATLDDIPDTELAEIAKLGFDWVYFLSVWQTGEKSRQVSRSHSPWLAEYRELLPDLQEDDICGSGFAIASYTLNNNLGEKEALIRLGDRLHERGLKLMLDFVPNHTGLDHHWLREHPDYYLTGTETLLSEQPQNYLKIDFPQGSKIFACGRDPYFDGWPDTLQLNYGNLALQKAMIEELLKIAQWCDGLRCDMAMLILPEIFERTWGIKAEPFWPKAIQQVKQHHADFVFMAEVYWNLDWTLQQQGFDYTYDKRLYDRLREQNARPVREHFWADIDYQSKSARFLENHDESRAAVTFPSSVHQAAAILTYFSPGLHFFHQGQLQGWSQKISVHLGRGPEQPTDEGLQTFYHQILANLRDLSVFSQGKWQLLECRPARSSNETNDCFIAFARTSAKEQFVIVVVNYADHQSQCYIPLPWPELSGQKFKVEDLMSSISYESSGDNLISPGLYVDYSAWGYQILNFVPHE